MEARMEDNLDGKRWLLLFLSEDALGVGGELDPIRLQKGMFLLSQRGPARGVYTFRPYNWGPYSSEINRHLHELTDEGLISRASVPGQSWSRYQASVLGEEEAAKFAQQLDADDLAWLRKAKAFVRQHSFTALLKKIYEEYPQYATRTMLR
jgi:uncharacterized protein YwgA